MMKIFFKRLVFISGIVLIFALSACQNKQPDDEKLRETIKQLIKEQLPDDEKLNETIKQVIRDNPKLMYDTINAYVRQQKAEEQVRRLDASFKNRVKVDIQPGTPVKGVQDAPVTIVEYTDFQCPYCARGAKTMEYLLKKYDGKVRVAFKNLPLEMHEQALPAAKAALAAHKQGKFWPYHDLLFANASQLDDATLEKFAKDLSLDVEQFNRDRQSDEIAKQVESDKAQAAKLNLRSTPMFIANGVIIKGAKQPSHFSMVIERLLKETQNREE